MRICVPRSGATLGVALVTFAAVAGCSLKTPPEKHYYERRIQPILDASCVGNTSPCHRIDPETGGALGNLDLSSFAAVQKRPDVLRAYGSYSLPLLLLKAVPEAAVQFAYQDRFVQSEIRHAGGKTLSPDSDAFFELESWLRNGANRDGVAPEARGNQGAGACNATLPPDRDLSAVDVAGAAYQSFVANVAPVLQTSCAFATCHSSPQSDFYITCGADTDQMKFNFLQAAGFVVAQPAQVERSEILLRPLAPEAGGVSHTGGSFFPSRDDETWKGWKAWGEAVQADPVTALVKSEGQRFFEARVMPKMLQRGCALETCHSPNGFNDFRLRPGAQGFFAPLALKRNYEATLKEFIALDTVDVGQSRAVKKNTFLSAGGIGHRAGSLLEGPDPADPTAPKITFDTCPTPFDPAMVDSIPAFCVFKEWHRLERVAQAGKVSVMAAGDVLPLAFVARPPNSDSPLEFDTFRGGADLLVADATLGARGVVAAVGNARSVLGTCSGLVAGSADVRGPEWSPDGQKLIFAGRPSAAGGFDLFVIDFAGGSGGVCRQLTSDNGRMQGQVKVHNFDPVFAPDGTVVFASTRTGTATPKTFLPNADLFRSGPAADFTKVEQMTWLLGSELSPAFMQDGRVTFTAEKASPEFYQLAGRRINWDLTDYHPLLAQRAQSTDTFDERLQPSVGYSQATEIREGLDRNFLVILSDVGARGGGGALATFNRSVGPFQADRNEPSFLKSMRIVDPAATGRAGTVGVYRSPSALPNGDILASYAANVQDPSAAMPKYDLVAVDAREPTSGSRRTLLTDATRSYVEAVVGYRRSGTELFRNVPQLVFGGHVDSTDDAIVHFPDLPMLATLLGANLRRGRNVALFDAAVALKVYAERPPAGPAPGGLQGSLQVYVDRVALGSARLEADHSLKVRVPARTPLIFELLDRDGKAIFTMAEEHQLSPGEYITPGVPRQVFNGVCGGCHGSISGEELDVAVTTDALTGASVSRSRDAEPKTLQ